MAGPLISYDQAIDHLRLPRNGNEEEQDLLLKMTQATAIVITYIKRPNHGWTIETNPDADAEFAIVQAAILKVLTDLYRDRGDEEVDARFEEWTSVNMRPDVRRMLQMLRDPALA
jgi:hypothetical protein